MPKQTTIAPPQKRYNVKVAESKLPDIETVQFHYGHQSISETIRFLIYQGLNAELQRQANLKAADSADALRQLTKIMQEMNENPNLPGLMDPE